MMYFWIVATLLVAGGLLFIMPALWGQGRHERVLAGGAALAFPLLVVAVYLAAGTPGAIAPQHPGSKGDAAGHAASQEQALAMIAALAQRMRDTPDNTEGWIMLARSYSALGRYADAALAYERATERLPDDARLLANYADIAAMAQGRRLAGKPEALIERALAADPQNIKALSLSGSAAFEKGDYAGAIEQWRKILALAPPGSNLERSVRGSIADAEQRSGKAIASAATNTAKFATAKPATKSGTSNDSKSRPSTGSPSVEGRVELAAAMRDRVKPDDTVFVFARVPGERMPLAMVRKRGADLPFSFRLDDSLVMNPAAKLSDAKEIVVVARVSRSHTAIPQAGDIEGASKPVRAGGAKLLIRIDTETAR